MFYIDCHFGSFIFAFTHQLFVLVAVEVFVALHCAKAATKVLVALRLCIQSCSEGFGGSASAHTN